MTQGPHKLWVEKYRPINLNDYLFQSKTQEIRFREFVETKTIPHLLLSGVQGSGKTTVARILASELNIDPTDVLEINASDENSVETMRDKIKTFVTSMAWGSFKLVILEEADYISLNGQALLRRLMEHYNENARFILTCNYENKITPPIKSRCEHHHFKAFDKNDIAERLATILHQEKVKFTLDQLDDYINVGYPDLRKIINLLQQYSVNGTLIDASTVSDSKDYKFELLSLIEHDNWLDARKLLCANVNAEEWEEVYRFLYENIDKSKKFKNRDKWESAIVLIAEHLYKHGIVADPEINAAAMLIQLGNL